MIERKIQVSIVEDTNTHKFYDDENLDFSNPELKCLYDHEKDYSFTFNKFKNNHELSKTESSQFIFLKKEAQELIKRIAKDKLEKQLAIEADREKDTQRAIELAKIINQTSFDNARMTVIKEKDSHSSWYRHRGELNTPSLYLTVVPSSVAKEAKELQNIRRKHQEDPEFDFSKTSYRTKEVRVADHENNDLGGYINSTEDNNWEKQYDWML